MKKSKLIIGTALSLGLIATPMYSNLNTDKVAIAVQSSDYENIYNKYTGMAHTKAKVLVKEYLAEVNPNASTNEKAELVTAKIQSLAEVATEGIFEMAKASGNPVADLEEGSLYNKWSMKLLDFYNNEGERIFNAYLDEALKGKVDYTPSDNPIVLPKENDKPAIDKQPNTNKENTKNNNKVEPKAKYDKVVDKKENKEVKETNKDKEVKETNKDKEVKTTNVVKNNKTKSLPKTSAVK